MSSSRTAAVDLAKLLDDGAAPVYVLDDRRQIVYCNPACARWLRVRVSELIGQTCAYHTSTEAADPGRLAAGLCPPPKAFCGQPQEALVHCLAKDGGLRYRRGHFLPLSEGADESAEVIAILETKDCAAALPGASADAQLHELVSRFRVQMHDRYTPDSLIGRSPAIARARAQIELASDSDASVLIIGARGSGKDHVAKAIHYGRDEPRDFVPLACAVVETNFLRSALRSLAMRSEVSRKTMIGTLVLEDVDCMPSDAQSDLATLLRAGSLKVRLISTAARPLAEAVREEKISAELACVLSTMTIELPRLTERIEDLPLLAQAFLEEVNSTDVKQVGGFAPEALDRLAAYHWPLELDELAEIVRQAHERAQGGEIAAIDLPQRISWAADAQMRPPRPDESIVLQEFLARVERELITRAMRRAKGNKSKAAKLLGLTRPKLYRRLVQLGMEPADERGA